MLDRKRRQLLVLGGTLAALPLCSRPAGQVHRVAWLLTTSPAAELAGPEPAHPILAAFIHELRVLGYAEGRNLVLERRTAEGRVERYKPLVDEVVRSGNEVIVMAGNRELNQRAKEVTQTVPIVIFGMSQPVKMGLVASLARPGGNITGTTVDSGPENEAKRLQLLKEALPVARRVAYLSTDDVWEGPISSAVRGVAPSLGVTLVHARHLPADLEATFSGVASLHADALFASLSAQTYGHREQIVRFALTAKLPGIYPYLPMAGMGGLLAYGVNVNDLGRQAAHYVDKILKGAKPGELPIEQPAKFDLVLNLRTAKKLGIAIPAAVLARADRVIE